MKTWSPLNISSLKELLFYSATALLVCAASFQTPRPYQRTSTTLEAAPQHVSSNLSEFPACFDDQ